MMNAGQLAGKTLFITGASRGIGKAIALKAARDGANVVIAAKTAEPHPKLPGTIYTAADEIKQAGGQALPCIVDVRNEQDVQKAVDGAVKQFGGIDIVVNNASAISLTGTAATPMKIYDLMNQINARGTYLCSKLCYPHLVESARQGRNPHIINISPPLSMKPIWFKNHTAYTMAKYGMSMCVLGMADEFKPDGIAVNALWPKTAIITAAMEMLGGGDIASKCRTPEIMADAAYAIFTKQSNTLTGHFLIDEDILKNEGITDMKQYAVNPDVEPILDFFVEDNEDTFDAGDTVLQKKPTAGSESAKIFQAIEKSLSEDIVKSIGGVYKFELTGDKPATWLVDLKNGSGSVAASGGDSDVTMKMSESDFVSLFRGQLSATQAFMQGKLNIEGNMGLAMKLETLMKNTKIEPDDASTTTGSAGAGSSVVEELINNMQAMVNVDMVNKVQATYIFKLTGDADQSWTLNLKDGEGSIVQGSEGQADVTMTMPTQVFVDIFNSKLAPTQAFMTGKLDIKGNMGHAMKLESIIKQINKSKL